MIAVPVIVVNGRSRLLYFCPAEWNRLKGDAQLGWKKKKYKEGQAATKESKIQRRWSYG